ncbi:uncharacterized protein LOC118434997 [Folsomia candida]|uniref:Uncharacterized protein n=1 Tax=Folsomia candida TaxID=158441 RepID=A0A226EIE1_FOLCA|nr:uncharacterized protein LOC118434997 [Folsomia candida]OXA57483.1 hypothetical protein Fcan01_06508 [Folsomia candida]
MLKIILSVTSFFLVFCPSDVYGRGLCASIAMENFPCQPNSGQVSRRIITVRDLAWLLTPHSYLITNGNQYTFRSLYETLLGSCASDETHLQQMRAGADFDMRNLVLFVEPVWRKNRTDTPFLHMICEPAVNHELWRSIYETMFKLKVRDFPSIEAALISMMEKRPEIKQAIRNFGRFNCKANPTCKNSMVSNPLCSPGVRMDRFSELNVVVFWTDHISDTTRTGTGLAIEGCLNGKPSWAVFSKVPHQSRHNLAEIKSLIEGPEGYGWGTHCWGNFNMWY